MHQESPSALSARRERSPKMDYKLVVVYRLHSRMVGILLLLQLVLQGIMYAFLHISTLHPPLVEYEDLLEQGILAESLQTFKRVLRIPEQRSRIPRHSSEGPSGPSRVLPGRMRSSRTGGSD